MRRARARLAGGAGLARSMHAGRLHRRRCLTPTSASPMARDKHRPPGHILSGPNPPCVSGRRCVQTVVCRSVRVLLGTTTFQAVLCTGPRNTCSHSGVRQKRRAEMAQTDQQHNITTQSFSEQRRVEGVLRRRCNGRKAHLVSLTWSAPVLRQPAQNTTSRKDALSLQFRILHSKIICQLANL